MPFHYCDKCKGPYCTGVAGCPFGMERNEAAEKMNASFPRTKFGRLRAIAKAIKQEKSNVRQP